MAKLNKKTDKTKVDPFSRKSRSKQLKLKKLSKRSAPECRSAKQIVDKPDRKLNQDDDIVRERKKAEFFAAPQVETKDALIYESFADLSLSRPLLKAIAELGWTQPTTVQQKAIPLGLKGLDICGAAVTGSGKTGAFMIPIIERLRYRQRKMPATRVLVIVPTRELGAQVHSVACSLAQYTDITFALCVGGLSLKSQESELKKRPDVVIATPGRLIDHIRNTASFTVEDVEILIMDEADRMLEDGFADELDEIIRYTPKSRQTMLFSATMTDNVDDLIKLSLNKPVRLFIHSNQAIATRLQQEFVRIRGTKDNERIVLLLSLCDRVYKSNAIVFFQSKKSAHFAKIVFGLLGISASELHGDLSQVQRLESLEEFKNGESRYLFATDLASRGIDISGVETVINFEMPSSYSQYVHRVGRTARAEQSGRSVSFITEKDRKIFKLSLKNSESEIRNRVVSRTTLEKYLQMFESIKDKIDLVLRAEKEEKAIQQAEMQVTKAENLIKYEKEIKSRPKRTWFKDAEK